MGNTKQKYRRTYVPFAFKDEAIATKAIKAGDNTLYSYNLTSN